MNRKYADEIEMGRYYPGIPGDHPVFDGHFPGNPVVPGVIVLRYVLQQAADQFPAVNMITTAKFTAPLGPGQGFEVDLNRGKGGRISFSVTSDGRAIAAGVLEHAGER